MGNGLTWEEIVNDFNFHETTPCMCGGVKNRRFRNKSYILYVRDTKNQFKLKKRNQTVIGLTILSELENKLTELFDVQEA